MAWIDKRRRRDGGVSARVVWRLGGTRDGAYQAETFSVGSDAQNLARADGFKNMVDAAHESSDGTLHTVELVMRLDDGSTDGSADGPDEGGLA